jgi:starvation-inducible DNA-binding protein
VAGSAVCWAVRSSETTSSAVKRLIECDDGVQKSFLLDVIFSWDRLVPTGKRITPMAKTAKKTSADIGVNLGMADKQRKTIAGGLSVLLADTYTLYLKTHNFHWNVTGQQFNSLHQMFEVQYTELSLAVDQIAERIRALAEPAPGSYSAFARLSTIKEAEGLPPAEEMVRILAEDQLAVVRTARAVFPLADEAHDEPTADLLTQRMLVHEKTAWMLRANLPA